MAEDIHVNIMNEAIQMFKDLSDERREELYQCIINDQDCPRMLSSSENYPHGRAFAVFMTRSKNNKNWMELNAIIASLVLNGLELNFGLSLYKIVHKNILNMRVNRFTHPPIIPWLSEYNGNQYYENAVTAAYLHQTPSSDVI